MRGKIKISFLLAVGNMKRERWRDASILLVPIPCITTEETNILSTPLPLNLQVSTAQQQQFRIRSFNENQRADPDLQKRIPYKEFHSMRAVCVLFRRIYLSLSFVNQIRGRKKKERIKNLIRRKEG